MYGHLARLGLIVPSNNTTVEPEVAELLPAGVAAFSSRVMVRETTVRAEKTATILGMHDRLDEAAEEVSSLHPAAIAYACTSGSFLDGEGSDRSVCERLSRLTGVPTITASTAVVLALRALGATRVALATPYIAEVSSGARRYLEETGVTVTAQRDLDLLSNLEKGRLSPDASEALVRSMDLGDSDAVFISCTNWRTLDAVVALETDLGLPVISSNLATAWLLLAIAGVSASPRTTARLMGLATVEVPDFVLP